MSARKSRPSGKGAASSQTTTIVDNDTASATVAEVLAWPSLPSNPTEWDSFLVAATDAGLAMFFLNPGSKVPAVPRPDAPNQGVKRANRSIHMLRPDLAALHEKHGEEYQANIGLCPGKSRLIVIDADTPEEVEAFDNWMLAHVGIEADEPTVTTPGTADGSHRGGGHWYYTVPESWDVPEAISGAINVEHAGSKFSVYAGNGAYVVAPPSIRAEGSYRVTGDVRDAPEALLALIEARAEEDRDAQAQRTHKASNRPAVDPNEPIEIWTRETDWADILRPAGWSPVDRDSCGCQTWARPGRSSKSAVAHEGCSYGMLLHIFSTASEQEAGVLNHADAPSGGGNWTKLDAFTAVHHDGDRRDAMTSLGLRSQPVKSHGRELVMDVGGGEPSESEDLRPGSSWEPVSMGEFLADDYEPPRAELLQRSDGLGLVYRGKTHSFHGESESGKSLIAQALAAEVLREGGSVLMLDYEDAPHAVGNRLRAFGAGREVLSDPDRFTYIRPTEDPRSTAAQSNFAHLLARPWDLAVIDGVTVSLSTMALGSQGDTDIATWQAAIPNPIAARTGAATIVVDHVIKASEARGRFATGSQHKMAGLSGASYTVDVLDVLRRGHRGRVRLSIGKDRPGGVREHLGEANASRLQVAAEIVIDSTGELSKMIVEPPANEDANAEHQALAAKTQGREWTPLDASRLDPAEAMFCVLAVFADEDGMTQTDARAKWKVAKIEQNSAGFADTAWKGLTEAEDFSGATVKTLDKNRNPTRRRRANLGHEMGKREDIRRVIRAMETMYRTPGVSGLPPLEPVV